MRGKKTVYIGCASTAVAPKKVAPKKVAPNFQAKILKRRKTKPHNLKEGGGIWLQAGSEWILIRTDTPAELPENTQKTGQNLVKGKLRVAKARKGLRSSAPDIKRWLKKRKHVEFWRDRNGTYWAFVTFYGATCVDQLQRAFDRMPKGGCYFALTIFEEVEDEGERRQGEMRRALGGESKSSSISKIAYIARMQQTDKKGRVKKRRDVMLSISRTPAFRASNEDSLGFALTWFYSGNLMVFKRRIGMAIRWEK